MTDDVAEYYNANTRRFLRFGKGGATGAIHRAVWAPGVSTQEEAMRYVDDYIAEVFLNQSRHGGVTGSGPILDLGCGVGASMARVGERVPYPTKGLTLSSVQADVARQNNRQIDITVGDFANRETVLSAAGGAGMASGAYMIESLCHATDVRIVFENLAGVLAAGAHLVVCDDLATSASSDRRDASIVERFKRYWHVRTFQTPEHLVARAGDSGFEMVDAVDLTQYIANGRPRDIAVRVIVGGLRLLPIIGASWDNMVGGDALQRLYRRGAARYMIHTFTRRGA